MGLSDEERIDQIYGSILRINEAARKIPADAYSENLLEIKSLASKLWHAFLGGQSNGAYWLLGGSSSNSVQGTSREPWGTAIRGQIEEALSNLDEGRLRRSEDTPFDAFSGFIDIGSLLSSELRPVFRIYEEVESLSYAVRRYNDPLRKQLYEVDVLISKIMGECFALFSTKTEFAAAYLLQDLYKTIYGPLYPYRNEGYDALTRWMVSENGHHSLPKTDDATDLQEVALLHFSLHERLRLAKGDHKKILLHRTVTAIRLHQGQIFPHVFKKLFEELAKDGVSVRAIRRIEEIVERKSDAYEKKKASETEEYRSRPDKLRVYENTAFASWRRERRDKSPNPIETSIPALAKSKPKEPKKKKAKPLSPPIPSRGRSLTETRKSRK